MKFPYIKLPGPDSQKPWFSRPLVPIRVYGPSGSLPLRALVDSGADRALFSESIGRELGLDVRSGAIENFYGIEGRRVPVFLLTIIPKDIFTGQDYVYTSDGGSYCLTYQMKLPSKQADVVEDYTYESAQRQFVGGANTATEKVLSVEAEQRQKQRARPAPTPRPEAPAPVEANGESGGLRGAIPKRPSW